MDTMEVHLKMVGIARLGPPGAILHFMNNSMDPVEELPSPRDTDARRLLHPSLGEPIVVKNAKKCRGATADRITFAREKDERVSVLTIGADSKTLQLHEETLLTDFVYIGVNDEGVVYGVRESFYGRSVPLPNFSFGENDSVQFATPNSGNLFVRCAADGSKRRIPMSREQFRNMEDIRVAPEHFYNLKYNELYYARRDEARKPHTVSFRERGVLSIFSNEVSSAAHYVLAYDRQLLKVFIVDIRSGYNKQLKCLLEGGPRNLPPQLKMHLHICDGVLYVVAEWAERLFRASLDAFQAQSNEHFPLQDNTLIGQSGAQEIIQAQSKRLSELEALLRKEEQEGKEEVGRYERKIAEQDAALAQLKQDLLDSTTSFMNAGEKCTCGAW